MSAWSFLKDVVRRPKMMGAVAPSGRSLARLMAESADVQSGQVIAELGAGTGALTQGIVDRAPAASVLCFEPGEELSRILGERFPQVRVTRRLAHELPDALAEWGKWRVDRIVCGLPWTIWPETEQRQILQAIVASLADDGRFCTFMYVHSQYLPGAIAFRRLLDEYFGSVTTSRIAWRNVPPAFVWIATKPRNSVRS
jgi:phosphatidylethanolamine/phosphatidyl-N-methylethanolamine N-methyltransferase